MKLTSNDVIDFARFYNGKDEPPRFYREAVDFSNKVFIPQDDVALAKKLNVNTRRDGILHYFVRDSCQNRLLKNPLADKRIHKRFFAVCGPDFSVDSERCFSCFNHANILKARIIARLWQACEIAVIPALIWGNKDTYRYAFDNIEEGCAVAVSHQSIRDEKVFKDGILYAIRAINPSNICWYGFIPAYMGEWYDLQKIVRMQTRFQLVKWLKQKERHYMQQSLF